MELLCNVMTRAWGKNRLLGTNSILQGQRRPTSRRKTCLSQQWEGVSQPGTEGMEEAGTVLPVKAIIHTRSGTSGCLKYVYS